jgi:hypothetical protein
VLSLTRKSQDQLNAMQAPAALPPQELHAFIEYVLLLLLLLLLLISAADIHGHAEFKKIQKRSRVGIFFKTLILPQDWAQRSRARIDKKNDKAVSFLLFFECLRLLECMRKPEFG